MTKATVVLDPDEASNAALRLDELLRMLKGSEVDYEELAAILRIAVKFGCATSRELENVESRHTEGAVVNVDAVRLEEVRKCLRRKSAEHLKPGGMVPI